MFNTSFKSLMYSAFIIDRDLLILNMIYTLAFLFLKNRTVYCKTKLFAVNDREKMLTFVLESHSQAFVYILKTYINTFKLSKNSLDLKFNIASFT